MITLRRNSTEKICELGGGAAPMVHPKCRGGPDLNIDVRPCHDKEGNQVVDFVSNFNEPLLISDDEWDVVFSHFVIEHLNRRKVRQFISEMFRICKPGGRIVCVTANTEAQCRKVLDDLLGDFDGASCLLFGDQDYEENSHRNYMSPRIAMKLFHNAGFEKVLIQPYGQGTDLLLEGYKPLEVKSAEEVKELSWLNESLGAATPAPPEETIEKPLRLGPTRENLQRMANTLGAKVEILSLEKIYNRQYFNGGYYQPFYWDHPKYEIVARKVIERKPESVLELGCGRGYVLKRLHDAGVVTNGIDVSKHCQMTAIDKGIWLHDVCKIPWPTYPVYKDKLYDLCFSFDFLHLVPEEHLSSVLKEMKRVSERSLHVIQETPHSCDWWESLFKVNGLEAEIYPVEAFQAGDIPEDYVIGDGKKKLNVGSAWTMFHSGWENLEINDLSEFARNFKYKFKQCDVRSGLPYPTGSVDLIYCGHFLEHLTYKEGLTFLRECRRVIKPTGAMRFIVPDAHKLSHLYADPPDCLPTVYSQPGNWSLSDFDEVSESCANSLTAAGKLWAMLHEGHLSCYDGDTITSLLAQAGFESFITGFRNGHEQILKETLDTHPSLSLYVNALPHQA